MRKRLILFTTIVCLIFTMLPADVSAKESKTTKQASKARSVSKKSKTVKAAKLTKKNKKARKAYKKFLERQQFQKSEYSDPKYALIDLDSNGIDELIFDPCAEIMMGQTSILYAYKNGKVKKMAEIPFVPFKIYTDGTFQSYYGHSGYMENIYYKLKKGSIKKRMEMVGYQSSYDSIPQKIKTGNGEYDGYTYWSIKKIDNKNVSYAACEKWKKKFDASHKVLKLKYRRNNKKNRNAILKKR